MSNKKDEAIKREIEVIKRVEGSVERRSDERDLGAVGYELVEGDRGLIALSPPRLRDRIRELDREMWFQSERVLEEYAKPDAFVNRIRLAFWNEYEKCHTYGLTIQVQDIARKVATSEAHVWAVFRNKPWLMWVLTPPASYGAFLDEALERGLQRLRSIIDAKVGEVDPISGRLIITDHKAAELVIKTVAYLDSRKHGGIVEKSLHLHAKSGGGGDLTARAIGAMTTQDLDARIAELEKKSSSSGGNGGD